MISREDCNQRDCLVSSTDDFSQGVLLASMILIALEIFSILFAYFKNNKRIKVEMPSRMKKTLMKNLETKNEKRS